MKHGIITTIALIYLAIGAAPAAKATAGNIPFVEITPTRLPDMHVPRFGHGAFYANGNDCFIGNEEKGEYGYLFPVISKAGQVSIVQVRDTVFSLLPTSHPIPMHSSEGDIDWYTTITVDRQAQRAYMMGHHIKGSRRKYLLSIDYAKQPAQLTCYYTDSLHGGGGSTPLLTPQGNIVLAGGTDSTNFTPLATVWQFPVGNNGHAEYAAAGGFSSFLQRNARPLAISTLLIILTIWMVVRKRRQPSPVTDLQDSSADNQGPALDATANEQLMQQITHLMEHEQLYLRTGLKLSDMAAALNTNSRYISDCIKASKGCSVSQFVGKYRIEHAQQLMTANPDMKLHAVATDSGFANDKALVRAFRDFTGMTPTEWKASQAN